MYTRGHEVQSDDATPTVRLRRLKRFSHPSRFIMSADEGGLETTEVSVPIETSNQLQTTSGNFTSCLTFSFLREDSEICLSLSTHCSSSTDGASAVFDLTVSFLILPENYVIKDVFPSNTVRSFDLNFLQVTLGVQF